MTQRRSLARTGGDEVEGHDGVGVESSHELAPLGALLGEHHGDRDEERQDHGDGELRR